ncbi:MULTISPECIES: F0F1 ATP synthase subunit B [Paenibacillus]|uniref:ATP synthase subunit b n=1 Tax=Paenibacillus naphthalenovorans TaxID=162209 RepID=A0A0U2L3R6_9BACL|nr:MULTISPECIES: F0F1 ATP synthase subunit B [Paenibacillus]ALS24530.1 subunit B of F0F1 ATP synthase [Paenibacillus naphthalenovorans]NTZ20843.1 ATP synthase F0 subunit B [Paenibacillus sp. JMULE4]GCL73625.1 ATP synthase F0 subunit B [Paenibacillus naphthalenovorans]SDJ10647.1 F-type H+-transporting ATPase subunit b [Paenibacillus naphthalenovorans]
MHFTFSSFIIAIISFGILMLLISKYAFGPLMGVMEQRRKLVLDQLQSAEQDRKQADALLAEQKAALEQVRSEAKAIIEQARVTSGKQAEDIIRQAKEEAARIKEEALRDIETEKNLAVAALRSQVSAMSVMIASKIIEKQIDEKSQEQLVEHYLKEVGGNQ